MNSYSDFFAKLPALRVAVVGDLMLDTYFFGQIDRISPEAPVPVVAHQHQEERIGGAGNVARNLRALGSQVELISLVGQDEAASILQDLLNQAGIGTKLLEVDPSRPTTRKTRVLDQQKQLLRLDKESTEELDPESERRWLAKIEQSFRDQRPDLVILEDYNKGVLSHSLIQALIQHCQAMNIVTAVDPKKKNFLAYQHVDLFKPNWREVSEALDVQAPPDPERLRVVHESLTKHLHHQVTLITLSEKGVYYQHNDQAAWLNSHPRTIVDVSGAGDTVIAVAAAAYAITRDSACMANLANLAGGLVCEQVGTAPISTDALRAECGRLGWLG
ncbi:MAG: carbohydrate kinase [Bacteroidetes bacterium]|nr:carbohydrate kinase [Bacteroidota bacterium]